MRVILGEIHKLLWLRNLLIAAAIGGLYYWVFVWQLVELFPSGHPATQDHQYAIAWHQEFGPTLEPAEADIIRDRLATLTKRADALIAADPTFKKTGITSWHQLRADTNLSEDAEQASWTLLFGKTGIGWQIQSIEGALANYGPVTAQPGAGPATVARVDQINDTGEWRALQSPVLLFFLREYAPPLCSLVFLVVLLVVSPLVTTDRVNRLRPLQASTRTGRRLLSRQLLAVTIVSVLLSVLVLALTCLPLGRLNLGEFWNTGTQTFLDSGTVYPASTLGQQCAAIAAMALGAGLLAGLTGFALSRASRTYPALALGVVVALAIALWVWPLVGNMAFSYDSLPAMLTGSPWSPLWVLTALATTLAGAAAYLLSRDRHIDIEAS